MEGKVFYGSQFKVCVTIDPVDGIASKDFEFSVKFLASIGKSVVKTKGELMPLDDDRWIACLDTKELGRGTLLMELTAEVPDSDFDDGYRMEVCQYNTNISIK